jgi:hypothetical protein
MVDDGQLLAELHEATRAVHETPAGFYRSGRAAFSWRNVNAELAELSYDSAAQPGGALAGTRAEPAALRTLTFAAAGVTIEIELKAAALQGHVVPPGSGEIDVQLRDGQTETVPVDDDGWFLAARPAAGLFRLHLRRADGGTAITMWTAL